MYISQYRDTGRAKNKKWNSSEFRVPRISFACHFGHSCHRFVSPALGRIITQAAACSGMSVSSCLYSYGEAAVSIPAVCTIAAL